MVSIRSGRPFDSMEVIFLRFSIILCVTRFYLFFSLCTDKLIELKPDAVEVISESLITVKPKASAKSSMSHVMLDLKAQLPKVVIKVRGIISSVYRDTHFSFLGFADC